MAEKGFRGIEDIRGSLNTSRGGNLDTATSMSSLSRLLFERGPQVSSVSSFSPIKGVNKVFFGMLLSHSNTTALCLVREPCTVELVLTFVIARFDTEALSTMEDL